MTTSIGTKPKILLARSPAAVQLHEKYRQPDPVDDVVKSELWRVLSEAVADPTDPLRSWNKEEKLLFPSLPPGVQGVLKRIDEQLQILKRCGGSNNKSKT